MIASSRQPLAPSASTSSSGLADGLGRRWLAFDREEGTMLERLVVRPELAAFEAVLRDRIDRLAALEDERVARPRTLGHAADGTLVVVSEFVPGSRLSDLLDATAEQGAAPGVEAAFGFLLDVLPALCGLHAGAGFAHGTIAPARMVLTPAGQVVLLDAIYGDALAHLRYTRRRLWSEFGVAIRPSAGAPRLDRASDVSQTVLAGVMLALGRPLQTAEYAAGLPAVLVEATDVAEIRVGTEFAHRFSRFLERALPLSGPRPFATADDALIELRDLASDLGGMHVCRRALIDFIEQMDPTGDPDTTEVEPSEDQPAEAAAVVPGEDTSTGSTGAFGPYDDGVVSILIERAAEAGGDEPDPGQAWDSTEPAGQYVEGTADAEINLDALVGTDALVDDELYCLDLTTSTDESSALTAFEDPLFFSSIEPSRSPGSETLEPAGSREAAARPPVFEPQELPQAAAVEPVMAPAGSPADTPAVPVTPPGMSAHVDNAPASIDPGPSADSHVLPAEVPETGQTVASPPAVRRRREKRSRSSRARKDKLRSARTADPPDPSPAERPAAKAQPGSWLVRADRVAAFDPSPDATAPAPQVVPFPSRPAPAPPVALPPPMVLYPPVPAPVVPPAPFAPGMLAAPPAPPTPYAVPWSPGPTAPPPLAPPAAMASRGQGLGTVRLKNPVPTPRAPRASPTVDIYASPLPKPDRLEEPVAFPWKIAATVVAVILVAVVAGRAYLPARIAHEDQPAAAAAIASAAAATPPFVPPAAPTGRLEIVTQPAGARVMLNGKPAGDTPLTIEALPAGRHTVTFVAASGSVTRTVRVQSGRTVKLDVPIFSGWVGIFAPFIVEVSSGGRVIGTTEEPRLMLTPGRHELTLTNRDLGYRAVQSVNIEPGEVRTITLDPRGTVNVNAIPWAEVWIDGQKVGETPIANLKLPLGIRDLVFRHPQFGERRATVTVKGDVPAALSVDMSR